MFKFILLELVKSYAANETPAKKSYSHLFSGILFLIAFIFLAFADYLYLYNFLGHESGVQNFLIISTALFLIALLIQIFSMCLNRKNKRRALSTAGALQKVVAEVLPIVVRLAPVGIIGYVVWMRVRSKMGHKNIDWKSLRKHFS